MNPAIPKMVASQKERVNSELREAGRIGDAHRLTRGVSAGLPQREVRMNMGTDSTAIATANGGLITAAQRRALFAAARARGMSTGDLRSMTPRGSISLLTWRQASDLLDTLNRGTDFQVDRRHRPRGPRRPKGVLAMVSAAQRRKIASLRIGLGWTQARLDEFLATRHYSHGGSMRDMLTSADGIEVIELLKGVTTRQDAACRRRSTETAHGP